MTWTPFPCVVRRSCLISKASSLEAQFAGSEEFLLAGVGSSAQVAPLTFEAGPAPSCTWQRWDSHHCWDRASRNADEQNRFSFFLASFLQLPINPPPPRRYSPPSVPIPCGPEDSRGCFGRLGRPGAVRQEPMPALKSRCRVALPVPSLRA